MRQQLVDTDICEVRDTQLIIVVVAVGKRERSAVYKVAASR